MEAATNIIHLYGPRSGLEDVQKFLERFNVKIDVTKDGSTFHIFFKTYDDSTLYIRKVRMYYWQICSGCDRCDINRMKKGGKKYVLYPPMALLPTGTSEDDAQRLASEIIEEHPEITHVAINTRIHADDVRRKPQIIPVVGDFGEYDTSKTPSRASLDAAFWVSCVQNGIYQTWAPLYTMFSRGNVTEKKRVLTQYPEQNPIEGTVIIDMYAGIGYFTLSYAKLRPSRILCWEINPWSVEGLLRAAEANGFKARVIQKGQRYYCRKDDFIVIFAENNSHVMDRIGGLKLAHLSHINLGLLPNSYGGIPLALSLCEKSQQNWELEQVINARLAAKKAAKKEEDECLDVYNEAREAGVDNQESYRIYLEAKAAQELRKQTEKLKLSQEPKKEEEEPKRWIPPIIHLHQNVTPDFVSGWAERFAGEIGECLHVEKVKRYSPALLHLCGDFRYDANIFR